MTRFISSIASSTTNSKSLWISKLACRKDEQLHVDSTEIEGKIYSSNDSIEITCSSFDNENEIFTKNKTLSCRRRNISISSFPTCSIGCIKETADNLDHETVTEYDNNESCTVNDASIVKDVKEMTQMFDIGQKKMTNREVLSPTLQLLHEVYLKKWRSNTGVSFLPSVQPLLKDETLCELEKKQREEEKTFTARDSTSCDVKRNEDFSSQQKQRMIFRQQLRYDAIRKELLENSNFDKKSPKELLEQDIVRHQEHNESDSSVVETVGCPTVSLWNFIPNMSNLFLQSLPENEVIDDDSIDERDSDDLSFTVGTHDEQSLFSYETESNSGDVEDEYTFQIPESYTHGLGDKQTPEVEIDNLEDPSCSDSFMDQSHIYLMMTSARKERAATKTSNNTYGESSPATANGIDGKKLSELTIDDFTIHSRIPLDIVDDDELIKHYDGDKYDFTDTTLDFRWVRHFQPFGSQQMDINIRQKQWIHAIHDSFNDHNRLDSVSDKQTERQLAANDALQRLLQQRTNQKSSNPLSSMTFHLWT